MLFSGTVKWYSVAKGYGFIRSDDDSAEDGSGEGTGKDVFVHHSEIADERTSPLVEGERVEFELVESERGLQARKVSRL